MLPPEASRRLLLSKTTLNRYEGMGAGVGTPSPKMINYEIAILQGIAALAPDLAELVNHIEERWIAYATANGLTLN